MGFVLLVLLLFPVFIVIVDSVLRLLYLVLLMELSPEKVDHDEINIIPWNIFFLIVACNEERVIEQTLTVIFRVLGTRPNCSVGVICDHCSDNTEKIALAHGAQVFSRTTGHFGKGSALSWFVQNHSKVLSDDDIVIILDADTLISQDFCEKIQKPFHRGFSVVQAFVQPIIVDPNPATVMAAYSELLSQYIDDAARMVLGWTAPLRGTGMAFRVPFFRKFCDGLNTQVEDIEISIRLATENIKVAFEPSAVFYDPKSIQLLGLARQRGRWLRGQREILQTMSTNIGIVIRSGPSGLSLIQACLFKPKTSLMLIKIILLLLFFLVPTTPPFIRQLLMIGLVLSFAIDLLYYFYGLRLVAQPKNYLSALLRSPIYLVLWITGWLYSILPGQGWLRGRDEY